MEFLHFLNNSCDFEKISSELLNNEEIQTQLALLASLFTPNCPKKTSEKGFGECSKNSNQSARDNFELNLDMQHFQPEDIKVKIDNNNVIVVEAEHGEKDDETGKVSRRFMKKIELPEEYDATHLSSRFTSNGVLKVTAPKKSTSDDEKEIPVIQENKVKGG
ncbi:alpha-crystallin B chain [Aethina tumida]|uniref:alpha-crystallin B chain n=1 Tax=Aethina tumida TaxID=116153 RepID=UPI00096B16C6|nr:alpha-crystallin B chain [Aethina tumida]